MRCLLFVPFLWAAAAFASSDYSIQLQQIIGHSGSPDSSKSIIKAGPCTNPSNLRAPYTRHVISLIPRSTSSTELVDKFMPECKKVSADERSSGTLEILDARFDGSGFVMDFDQDNKNIGISKVVVDGKRLPIFQGSHLFHNVYIHNGDDDIDADCFAMAPISKDMNAFDVTLEETDKNFSKWECRAIARPYAEEEEAGVCKNRLMAPVLGSPNIVRLISNVGSVDISVAVDDRATDFCFSDQTDEEVTPSGDSKDKNTDAEEEATTSESDRFKVMPRKCSMCRESLRRLDIPIGSAIIPYLTPKMVNSALDDQDRQTQRGQDEDDPSQVVPGCVKCQEFLNELGIPSNSPIVPYLNTDILASALNDMEENVSAGRGGNFPQSPQKNPKKEEPKRPLPFTMYTIWTKITPLFRNMPIFFHKPA